MLSKILRFFNLYDKAPGKLYRGLVLHHKHRLSHRRFMRHGPEALAALQKTFDRCGVDLWLDFGSLLGCIREGGLIAHDDDIDLAMRFEDFTPDLLRALFDEGFLVKRIFRVKDREDGRLVVEAALVYKEKTRLDIFFRHGDECYCLKYIDEEHKACNIYKVRRYSFSIKGLEQRDFLGVKVRIPGNAPDYLEYVYGKGYMSPDENWKPDLSKELPFPDYYGEIIGTW